MRYSDKTLLKIILSSPMFFLLVGCSILYQNAGKLGDTQIRPKDQMVMVFVPSGEFRMGSTKEMVFSAKDICKEDLGGGITAAVCTYNTFMDEYPDHTVEMPDYWLDQTEINNGQYRLCVESGECDQPNKMGSFTREHYYDDPAFDDYPVVQVTWNMAADYCKWAGVRLPTEAEWEYAARGPEAKIYPWGNDFDPSKLNYCDAGCKGISDLTYNDNFPDTAPVGSFPEGASWIGALDMAGNVREWVADWYGYYHLNKLENPQGPAEGEAKTLRGGSWYDPRYNIRSNNRGSDAIDYWRHKVGFRCAVDS